MLFNDRHHAGLLLSEKLSTYSGPVVVIGLARGGVEVASAIASKLRVPLDVLVVKKIGAPGNPELAIGAVAPDGVRFINWKLAGRLGVDGNYVSKAISLQQSAISEKARVYRKGKKPYALQGRTVILADDGAATGATLQAAIKWLRRKHTKKVVVVLPVAPKDLLPKIMPEVDEFIVLETPDAFEAVGQFYKNFPQVEDREVIKLVRQQDNKIAR